MSKVPTHVSNFSIDFEYKKIPLTHTNFKNMKMFIRHFSKLAAASRGRNFN